MDKIAPILSVMETVTRVITRVVKEVEENKKEFPGKEKQILALSIVQGFLKELGINVPDEDILRYIDSIVGLYNALGLFSKKKILSKEEWEKTIVKPGPDAEEWVTPEEYYRVSVSTTQEINNATPGLKGKMINGEFIPKEVLEEVGPLDVSYYGQEEAIERARKKVKDAIQE